MLQLMNENIALNFLSDRVKTTVYDWGAPVPSSLPRPVDILLAADCVYFEPAFPLLQTTLQDLIQQDTICYFCFKKRRRADMQFVKAVKRMFDVQEIEDDPGKDNYRQENIFL